MNTDVMRTFASAMQAKNINAIDVTLNVSSWEEADVQIARAKASGLICGEIISRQHHPEGPYVIAVALTQKDLEEHENKR